MQKNHLLTSSVLSLRRSALLPKWVLKFTCFIAFAFHAEKGQLHAQGEQESTTNTVSPSTQQLTLRIGGEVPAPAEWKLSEFARLPRSTVRVKDRDGRDITYGGVSLTDVLRAVSLRLNAGTIPSRETVAKYILIVAADGYRAVFATAEIDPALTERTILLADQKDGQLLSSLQGPLRIVVPGEKRPARWVRQVRAILIGQPNESAP
ncbi:MAG: molybdopterin-dependent oxidoreductase [Verrucomicrobia bacterium]|nr:molybdopterin-dependent oxidoreductase [Verrucomicrobiota bacterium]